jgi:hypothetical protein
MAQSERQSRQNIPISNSRDLSRSIENLGKSDSAYFTNDNTSHIQ